MADRTPGEGKYAQVEREQRWLVLAVPGDAERVASIHDRYIHGTSLRLRQTETGNGTTYKFCQKIRRDPTDPMTVKITHNDRFSGGALALASDNELADVLQWFQNTTR